MAKFYCRSQDLGEDEFVEFEANRTYLADVAKEFAKKKEIELGEDLSDQSAGVEVHVKKTEDGDVERYQITVHRSYTWNISQLY